MIAGLLCGIAGTYLALAQSAGFGRDMTAGQGYIALAALIFANWRPWPVLGACFLFGLLNAASIRLQGVQLPYIGPVPGSVHPGSALYPDRHPACRLHRQVDAAARRRRALREGAVMADSAELFEAARAAMSLAHVPYSQFPVGAALRSETGRVFAGCNIENASYPEGWCAETSAIAHMVMAGERRIGEVAVVAEKMARITPCGGCRQRLQGIRHGGDARASLRRDGRGGNRHARRASAESLRAHLKCRTSLKGTRPSSAPAAPSRRASESCSAPAWATLRETSRAPSTIPYGELEGFPVPGVSGPFRLARARPHRRRPQVAVLAGRAHYYEHGRSDVMRPALETLQALGVDTLILTNAAGSLRAGHPARLGHADHRPHQLRQSQSADRRDDATPASSA